MYSIPESYSSYLSSEVEGLCSTGGSIMGRMSLEVDGKLSYNRLDMLSSNFTFSVRGSSLIWKMACCWEIITDASPLSISGLGRVRLS